MAYFKNVNTLEELRKQYRDLLKKYHPDNINGNTDATQEINAEYDKLFKILKDKHDSNATDSDKTSYNNMKYDFSEDQALRDMLNKIIRFSNITIEICGLMYNSFINPKDIKKGYQRNEFPLIPLFYCTF